MGGSGKDTGNLPLDKLTIMRHSSSSVGNNMGLIAEQSVLCTALSVERELLFSFAWGRKRGRTFLPYPWIHLLDRQRPASHWRWGGMKMWYMGWIWHCASQGRVFTWFSKERTAWKKIENRSENMCYFPPSVHGRKDNSEVMRALQGLWRFWLGVCDTFPERKRLTWEK